MRPPEPKRCRQLEGAPLTGTASPKNHRKIIGNHRKSWGLPCPKIENMAKFVSCVFDRNESLIQAFVDFIIGKLMSGHSSSSTFHDFGICSFYKTKNKTKSTLQISDLQIFKFLNSKIEKLGTQDFQHSEIFRLSDMKN